MKNNNSSGTGLIELLIIIPVLFLLLAGTINIFRLLDVKSEAIHDAMSYTLIKARKESTKNPEKPYSLKSKTTKLIYSEKELKGKTLLSLFSTISSKSTETVITFTPRNIPVGASRTTTDEEFREKVLIVCDPWDESSPVMKKLEKLVLYPPRVIAFRYLSKIN